MNRANNIIINKYNPDDDLLTSKAENWSFNDDLKLKKHKMEEFNCGSLPPTWLHFKIGCILMLLRNWRLSEGSNIYFDHKIHNDLRFGKWDTFAIT